MKIFDKPALVLGILAVGSSTMFVAIRLGIREAVRRSLIKKYYTNRFKYGVGFIIAAGMDVPKYEPEEEYVMEAIHRLAIELVPIVSLSIPTEENITLDIEGRAMARAAANPSILINSPWVLGKGIEAAYDFLVQPSTDCRKDSDCPESHQVCFQGSCKGTGYLPV